MHGAHLITPLCCFSFCPAPAYSNFLPPSRRFDVAVYVLRAHMHDIAYENATLPSRRPPRINEIKFVLATVSSNYISGRSRDLIIHEE